MTLAQDNEPVPEPSTESNPPTREQLSALLEKALPAVIVDDNVELLRKLVAPVLEPLSVYETVDPNKSARELLGRGARRARECVLVVDRLGGPDIGDRVWSQGSPGGEGVYKEMRFDKLKLLGNIAYNTRDKAAEITPDSLVPVKMSNSDAAQMAAAFGIKFFGLLPAVEILDPSLWQVESLAIGFAQTNGNGAAANGEPRSVVVEKLVRAPRMLNAGLGSLVPVLGSAHQAAMDDNGVKRAYLREWTPWQLHPDVDPKLAHSRRGLSDSVLDKLMSSGLSKVPSTMSSLIAYVKARDMTLGCPDDDESQKVAPGEESSGPSFGADNNGGLPPELEAHMYVPALVLFVSMGPDDPTEEEQSRLVSSTSMMEQFPLVDVTAECGQAAESPKAG